MKKTIVLSAGESTTFPARGRFLFVAEATGEVMLALRMSDGRIVEESYTRYDNVRIPEGLNLKEITATDASGSTNTVTLRVSDLAFLPSNDGQTVSVSNTVATSSSDLGTKADTAATTDAGTFSLIALVKRLLGKIPALGQATGANSLPVVLASDQGGLAVAASTAGGADTARLITGNSTNTGTFKTAAGRLFTVNGTNTTAGTLYLKLYNLAAAPNLASDTPVITLALPPGAFNFEFGDVGVQFGTGIAHALTGAVGDNDTTVTNNNDAIACVTFK